MKPAEKSEFARLITDVLAYYRQDASSFTLSLWWHACQNFDMEQVSKALSGHAMDAERGVYAPKVADVVRVLAGTMTDRAALAWGKVLGTMSAVGAYCDVVFDDPAIHAAIEDLGGWVKVCRGETAELGYLQHRFCQLHKAYTGQGTFEYPRRLIADRSPDSDFTALGLPLPRFAIVGDRTLALQVYHAGSRSAKTSISMSGHHDVPCSLAGGLAQQLPSNLHKDREPR